MPHVSILLPTYNSLATVSRAVESVRGQTFSDWELLCVDDASSDNTAGYLEEVYANDNRIRVIRQETNSGPAVCRNLALDQATGIWIALIDADDAWKINRLEVLLEHSEAADLVADNLLSYDATALTIAENAFPPFGGDRLTLEDHLIHWVGESPLDSGYLKPLMRRAFLISRGLAYDHTLRHGEDFHLYSAALCAGAIFVLVNYYGYLYSTPVGGVSGRKSPHSQTKANELLIASRIRNLQAKYWPVLSDRERRAFEHSLDFYISRGTLRIFRSALQHKELLKALGLIVKETRLRRELYRALGRRLGLWKESRPTLN